MLAEFLTATHVPGRVVTATSNYLRPSTEKTAALLA
jgi:hypothetical protein